MCNWRRVRFGCPPGTGNNPQKWSQRHYSDAIQHCPWASSHDLENHQLCRNAKRHEDALEMRICYECSNASAFVRNVHAAMITQAYAFYFEQKDQWAERSVDIGPFQGIEELAVENTMNPTLRDYQIFLLDIENDTPRRLGPRPDRETWQQWYERMKLSMHIDALARIWGDEVRRFNKARQERRPYVPGGGD